MCDHSSVGVVNLHELDELILFTQSHRILVDIHL